MKTPVFSGKLDSLYATLDLLRVYDPSALADGIAGGTRRHALAIGSGGSAITAEYFARCRDTLGLGPTTVQTPMQAVLGQHDLAESDVWLFSAGGDNPDVVGASRAALDRKARHLHLVTRNPNGLAASIVKEGRGWVHVVPVAEQKDGYLATHSLLSSVVALLLASDAASRDARGTTQLLDHLSSRITDMRSLSAKQARLASLAHLQGNDTVFVAGDPLLRPMSALIETSIWEASLCHVQAIDFRNFAHGRHAWLHHRPEQTVILALTGVESRPTWAAIDAVVPVSLRRLALDYSSCGRLENALALVDGFGLIESMGAVLGADPGSPGIGDFGRSIYEDRSLADLAEALPVQVRHKRAAIARSDSHDPTDHALHLIGRDRLLALSQAEIGAAVFDYDGTIVATDQRWSPPGQAVIDELVRLHRAGFLIGFATGRGGSAGEELRKALPADMLPAIPIGYYNGGHLRPACDDISLDLPLADPTIAETVVWLESRGDLFLQHEYKSGAIQITVEMKKLRDPHRFAIDLMNCPPFSEGRVRVLASGHSYDIVPLASSKLSVVEVLRARLPAGLEVLCFGDSGSRTGNDHALLAHPFGISVGEVCGAANGCWSLFGADLTGPNAVLRVLRALVPTETGAVRLDVQALGLDSLRRTST